MIEPEEAAGVRLANSTVRRIGRSQVSAGPAVLAPEGPHFYYDASPSLFLGRVGRGPLRIAWDTNLLIDYFKFGEMLWNGDSLPDELGPRGEELEGLQMIISLWVLRDIRFTIPLGVIDDSKRKALSPERRRRRLHAWREFELALTLVADEDQEPERKLPDDEVLQLGLARVPEGNDRKLVQEALAAGAHAFLTCDKGVLRAHDDVAQLGLLVASPLDLLEEIAAAGALHCLLSPEYLYWPMPDQQRVAHLIQALAE